MVGGLIAKALLILAVGQFGEWHGAFAVRYDPGVFARVSRNRGLPIVACMVAHPTLPIGTWIEVDGPAGRERARITDTSAPADKARHIRLKRVELDYSCARRVCPPGWQGAAVECPISWRTLRR